MQAFEEELSAPIKRRVYNYLKDNGIQLIDFCEKIGISPSAFRGKDRKSEFGGAVISRIAAEFPAIPLRWLITGDRNDSPSVHIAGGTNAVAHGGSSITYNNGYAEAGRDSSIDSSTVITLLQKIIDTQNELLAKKDEQIDGLIKAIQR